MKDIATIGEQGLGPVHKNPGYSALVFAALSLLVPLGFWGFGGVLGVVLAGLSLFGIPALGALLARRANVTNQFLSVFLFASVVGYGIWFFLGHGLLMSLVYTFLVSVTMFVGTAVGTNRGQK